MLTNCGKNWKCKNGEEKIENAKKCREKIGNAKKLEIIKNGAKIENANK